MPDFNSVIERRISCRKYLNTKVTREQAAALVRVGQKAPNSCNQQSYHFIFVDDAAVLRKLAKVATGKVNWAPCLLVAANDIRYSRVRNAGLQSLAASVQNILLAADAAGLGTCMMAGFKNDAEVRAILNLPDYFELISLIAIGYPSGENSSSSPRYFRPIREVLSFNSYQAKEFELPNSSNVRAWTIDEVLAYRRRIASVYGSRGELTVYPLAIYQAAIDCFASFIEKYRGVLGPVLDFNSYDGFFARQVAQRYGADFIHVSDFDDQFLKDLALHTQAGAYICIPTTSHDSRSYEVITLVQKIEFHPKPVELLRQIHASTKPNGHLFLTTTPLMCRSALRHWLNRFRSGVNGYEGNPYYRIGPYCHMTAGQVRRALRQANWKIEMEKLTTCPGGFKLLSVIAKRA